MPIRHAKRLRPVTVNLTGDQHDKLIEIAKDHGWTNPPGNPDGKPNVSAAVRLLVNEKLKEDTQTQA